MSSSRPSASPGAATASASSSRSGRSSPMARRSASTRWYQSSSSIAVGKLRSRIQRIAAAPSDEEDALGVEHPEPGAGRGESLGEHRPAAGAPDVRPIGQRPAGPARPPGAVEDEADLDLELGPRRAVVDHRPVGAHPDRAAPRSVALADRSVTEDRLGLESSSRIDPGPSSAAQRSSSPRPIGQRRSSAATSTAF